MVRPLAVDDAEVVVEWSGDLPNGSSTSAFKLSEVVSRDRVKERFGSADGLVTHVRFYRVKVTIEKP